jgi:Holliday junction resolvase RusA-like endonuclease
MGLFLRQRLSAAGGRRAGMAILDCFIPGDPVSKGRPRQNPNGGRSFTPARTREAEFKLREWFFDQLGRDVTPFEGDVGVAVEFFCATKRRTDGDNLLKLVTDSMNKLVIADDSQILEWFARVHRGVGSERAGTSILVYELKESAPV